MEKCSVSSCTRSSDGGHGWCRAHYMRWYQTGDVRADVPLRLHNVDPQLRFWPKVDKAGPTSDFLPTNSPCWTYTGHIDRNGYGLFRFGGSHVGAHRFSYEVVIGPIPAGLELDHLCNNRSCVNPSHLEPVTRGENVQRAVSRRTHCKHGHEFTEDNTRWNRSGGRVCVTCNKIRSSAFYYSKKINS